MNPIAIKIKEVMIQQGLSEQKLADKAGLTQNKVHRIVSGKAKRLDIDAINSLVAALGINTGETPVTPITGTSHERLQLGEHAVGTVGAAPDPIRAAINQELDRMTRPQLAEVLSILVAKNEERSPHARG